MLFCAFVRHAAVYPANPLQATLLNLLMRTQ